MAAQQRVGGTVYVKRNGKLLKVKTSVEYNLGLPMREAQVGQDGVHGYSEKHQVPYIACTISDGPDVDIQELAAADDDTVTAELINGKTIVLRNAWAAGPWTGRSENGEIEARWEGLSASEVSA